MRLRLLLVLVVLLAGGGVVLGSAQGARPTVAATPPPVPGVAAPAARPAGALASTWYCAGGTAEGDGLADHRVVVANPGDQDLTGLLTVFPGRLEIGGTTADPTSRAARSQTVSLPARSRTTFRLADLVAAPVASAVVEVNGGGVAVDHEVVGPHGRDRAACASGAAPTWHFAWGSTARDAHELLVLFNPFPSEVTVDATFVTEGGVRQPLRWQGLVVPSRQVVALDVGRDVTRRDQVAATVRARGGGRLVVDRLEVFDGSDRPEGVSVALGQPTPSEVSVFAGGLVDGEAGERIVLYNPGTEPADVEVSVQGSEPGAGPVQPFGVVVRPGRHEVVDYTTEERVPRGTDHTTVVRSRNGVPVVAEQVRIGGELAAGAGALFRSRTWIVPAAATSDEQGVRFAVFNPDADRPVRVSFDLDGAAGRSRPPGLQGLTVPAGGRIDVALPEGGERAGPESAVARSDGAVVVAWAMAHDGTIDAAGPGIPVGEGLDPL